MDEDIQINFSDETISSNLDYEKVRIAVEEDLKLEEWVVPSEFGMILNNSDSHGLIKFWKNKNAVLVFYESSFDNDVLPTDVIFLHQFLKENGWTLIIDDGLMASFPEYWNKFYSAVYDINIDDIGSDGKNLGDEQDLDFIEYERKIKEFGKTIANSKNKIGLVDLKEFDNHRYDLNKREKKEKDNLF